MAKAAVLTVTLLTLFGGFGTKTANAHELLPKHHKLNSLPLKNQANWYKKNMIHARANVKLWKATGKLIPFLLKKSEIGYHTRLLRNSTRNYKRVERKIAQIREQRRIEREKRREANALPAHYSDWLCIHRYEGAWNDPNPPYYGGLQMDWGFMSAYGGALLKSKGTADHWTPLEQMQVAENAYQSGRGFYPWPTTARMCGLI